MQRIDEMTEEYSQSNATKMNDSVRAQYYNKLLVFSCMRDPSDKMLQTKMADSVEEIGGILDMEDIARVCNAYGELMINKAPKLEVLTQDQYDTIKNFLGKTQLSDISTVLLVHLINCHQTIVSEE
jgi:hypothetical protein